MTHFRELTDRYTLEKILRSTRGGSVLRAVDNRTGQAVAVKLINVTSPALLVQKAPELEKLGAALESLREPGLPAVMDFGLTTDGSAFLVMELLEGKTLDALAGPPQRLLGLLAQALDGLEALARRGIAHQNLSADNLFVVFNGDATPEERVKVLGLGGALFRAPEPGREAPAPDVRDDLAAFARICCQVLGITVGPGDSPSVQMPFALTLELENSEAFRQVLERCLRGDPAGRPSHAEVRDALRRALGAPVAAPPPLTAPKLVVPAAPPPSQAAPAPAGDGELLSAIDDDILNALATAPPAPANPAAPPPAPAVPFRGAGSAVAAVPPPKPNPLLRPGVLIGIAAVLILAAVGTFWWLGRGPAPAVEQAEAPEAPPPPPRRPAAEVLAEAQLAMADERWSTALAALGSLNGSDQATLGPAGCRALAATEETLARIAADRLPEILAQGLKEGDLDSLRFAAWAAETQDEASLSEALRADLARGRGILDLYAAIEEAASREADIEVLEKFAALEQGLPGASDPQGFRAKAAAAVEARAEELAREGKYEDALVQLDSVVRYWPQRETARERSELYARARQLTAEQQALLEALPAALRRKKPHEGLEMLEGVEPVPHLAAQIADMRKQLEDQLALEDQQPPQVVLRDGFFLDYDRGQVVELSFRVTDDYQVESVKLMARPEGGKMRELPLEKSSLGYTAEIPPDFHRNSLVEIYVVATDTSGHEGFFGTPGQPKLLQRRRGFDRLVN